MLNSRKTSAAFALVTFVAVGCAHDRTRAFESALSHGACEDALESIPEKDGQLKFLGRVNRTAGTALSYAATGAGYTADVVLTVAGGTVLYVALCAPMIAVSMAAHGVPVSGPGVGCLPLDLTGVKAPHFGHDIYKGTEEMRCPDLTALSRSVRRVASCNESQAGRESLERAKQTLQSLTGNSDFMNCITEDERGSLRNDLYRLDGKIARLATPTT